MRKTVKGVPVWVIAVVLASVVCGALAAYIFSTVKFPVEVKEPLSVVAYPDLLSFYPNTTESFNVTVNNVASVNYLVFLAFSLNDTPYQQAYVTFSNETYPVIPGLNNLTAWISVAADAPPAQLELTVELSRVSAVQPAFGYTFIWTNETQNIVNGTLMMKLDFRLTEKNLLVTAQINWTEYRSHACLGLMFDKEFDGFKPGDGFNPGTQGGFIFTADNRYYDPSETMLGQDYYGWYVTSMVLKDPDPSPYHNCTFNNVTGYTFHITLPKNVIPEKTSYFQVWRVHVDFGYYSTVHVEFSLEKPFEGIPK